MWLVLCPSNDLAALWAYQGLKSRGLAPLELVSAEMLAYALRWEHRLSTKSMSVEITLADHRTIRSDAVRGILNRLSSVPQEQFERAGSADRNYAAEELTAFYMSWLCAMPQPVLNRPTAQGLSGSWRHLSEWVWMARKVGLPTFPYRQTGSDKRVDGQGRGPLVSEETRVKTIIVVGGDLAGASAPPDILEGCRRLAKLSGTALLGIEFVAGPQSVWSFAGATPLPDLRLGGAVLLELLASALVGEGGEGR